MLGWLEWRWLGYLYPSTTKTTVGGGCCRWAHRTVQCATGYCPVRQPRHPTVRVLAVSTVGALSSCGTGQVLFTIRCASDGCSDFCANCPHTIALCRCPLQSTVALGAVAPLVHWTVRWHTGQSSEL
jgi:hypothetical protein